MKLLIMIAAMIFASSSCSDAQRPSSGTSTMPDEKILIVYLSRTNNTKVVAEMIRDNVGGTLVPLELENPYPENYEATVKQVVKENEKEFLPPLKTKIDDIKKYDVVFLGFPTWDMQIPPPMKSFLSQYNFKGKTVIPFNTHAGYGAGNSFQTVRQLCRECKILDGFSTEGGIEKEGVLLAIKDSRKKEVQTELKNWLRKIKMVE